MEFASQQSLETVFLVELTSSVHLATLKIAKSLVVSKSGSSSAAVALCDVLLGVSAADINQDWYSKKMPYLVPKVFKSCFVSSASYAKTGAPSGLSEFPPLVVFLAASATDPAVSSRLDSLEKQISDLVALVKSIVEPVGSLVALIFHFLDDNAVKTVQVEKDIVSMKSVANNFSNFMVGVSKNIACLRSEVDFGDMDYNSVLAAKPFFLSEDTIEHVIAL
ncbi:hypothetical protein G9A89_017653 [Geosiphon pyriformis]|nr:hypothetical protein G9A89_017653 [Geosiphon pyriformis]